MKSKIMILSALDYEKDGKQKGCIKFIFADKDKFEDTEKYLGYNVCTQYYNGFVRQLVPKEFVGQPVIAVFQVKTSYKDPLRTYNTIESIELDGKVVHILKSK